VALPAWLGWMASSKSKAGRSAALQVGLIRRESAPELEVVSLVFIGLLFSVKRTARRVCATLRGRSCAAKANKKRFWCQGYFPKIERLKRLANHGIPLGNQSVVLKGVNDDLETMKPLVHKLLMCRVRPFLHLPVRPDQWLIASARALRNFAGRARVGEVDRAEFFERGVLVLFGRLQPSASQLIRKTKGIGAARRSLASLSSKVPLL
jgi:hypothetical protein